MWSKHENQKYIQWKNSLNVTSGETIELCKIVFGPDFEKAVYHIIVRDISGAVNKYVFTKFDYQLDTQSNIDNTFIDSIHYADSQFTMIERTPLSNLTHQM